MHSDRNNDISQQFKNWNPMRDAYNDSNFNKYVTGPGADIDENLQRRTAQRKYNVDPYLVFRNVPQNLTVNGLLNICSTYGKPLRGRKNEGDMYFVDFASLNDMERVFTNLQNNSYGLRVFLGNQVKKGQLKNQPAPPIPDLPSFPKNSIDYDRMPKKDKNFIRDQQKTNRGSFNANSEKFVLLSPVIDKVKSGPCSSCQNVCVMVCARCSAFFCSTECQQKEWPKHRYICGKPLGFALPEDKQEETKSDKEETTGDSSKQPDSREKAALKAQFPSSGSKVILTAISKTNVVFVRSVSYDDNMEFFKTVSIIQREAKSQKSLQHTPQRGDIVLVKFKEDQYNRAMILNPDDLDRIKLIYIDYGNIDSRPLDQLLDAPDQFWHLPRMAVPVILQNVPDFFMTDEVKKYMYAQLNTDMKIVYKADDLINGIHQAELLNFDSGESFNKHIASLRGPTSESGTPVVLFKNYLQSLPLPDGEKVELIVMDNSLLQTAFVSCTTEDYARQIQMFQDDIQAYAKLNFKDAPYLPRVNELCIAKYDEDNLWYRGICIERVGDGHPSILFFDYGNLSTVNVDNIRPYPQEFTFPIMTGDCEIHGLPEKIEDDLKKKLENELPVGKKIICDKVIKFTEDSFYSIHLKDLLAKVLN